MRRLGSLPILWAKWKIRVDWTRLKLPALLDATNGDALLFLDLKGKDADLGVAIVEMFRTHAPERHVVLCGRNYAQLDPVVSQPKVTVFYSVGELQEFAAAWPRLEQMEWPAISLHRKLATPKIVDRLREMHATIICWDVHTTRQARYLYEIGVDGFTSDNLRLLGRIAKLGPEALA